MIPDDSLKIGFAVSNIEKAKVTASVSTDDEDYHATVSEVSSTGEGTVTVYAPELIPQTKTVKLTLKVEDNYSRTQETTEELTASASDLFTVSYAEKDYSYTAGPEDTIGMKFTVSNLGVASVTSAEAVAPDGFSVSDVVMDGNSGSFTLTSNGPVTGNYEVGVNVSDDYGRVVNAKQSIAYTAVTIASANANTYVVAPGSVFRFNATEGSTSTAVDFDSAELTWQTVKGMVKKVSYVADKRQLTVTLDESSVGGALISVMDQGTVVWNYLLWITDYDPEENIMSILDENSKSYSVMDRNIGASSAIPGEASSHGFFYQWGRMQPFASPDMEGNLNPVFNAAGDTVRFTSEACTEDNNVAVATANPTVYYTGNSANNYSWCVTRKSDIATDAISDLWGGVTGQKMSHDPCPAGWKVAPIAVFSTFAGTSVTLDKVFREGGSANSDLLGYDITSDGKTSFFPNQGEIMPAFKYANGQGSNWPCGKMWSATVDATYLRGFGASVSPSSYRTGGFSLAYGLPVRCVKE
ncbi:MAG: hypothetical protein LKK19_03170 [Bacteroidales bacterium]|nr:hypothetical protein [Bacteroidales bacterium]MCI2144888.1 hypothetical protein [Bacteroidales bacterium]